MLNFYGRGSRMCDGVSRRGFLKVGTLGLLGGASLNLADILRAEAATGKRSHKAVINVFLGGGPPHQDMWEIKTDAPSEIRGEFKPIRTNVPDVQIGEVFKRLARMWDKCAAIRSVVGARDRHDAFQCNTGWMNEDLRNIGGRPSVGACVTKLFGPVDPAVPAFVGLAQPTQHMPWSDRGKPGFLGPSFLPFTPDGPGMENMRLNSGISLDRLADRRSLLSGLDGIKREMDGSGSMAAMDLYGSRALDVLTSSKLVDALDLSKEDPKIVARYGDGKPYKYQFDGAPTCNDHLLIARRLVEAGARVVTLSFGRWDSHGKNFDLVRDHGDKLDQALSALIEDLEARGMLDDVTVIAWGEFGRTPKINNGAGRDHWPQVSCAFMAGGGMKTGQAIGATNRLGEYAANRPVTFQEIIATLYHNLGIDVNKATITDPTGRPQYLVEAEPIKELVG
jgi:hypothetical protein